MNEKIISLAQPLHQRRKSETDLQRLDTSGRLCQRTIDEDIDLSDCPEITPEQFAKGGGAKRFTCK